MIKSEKINSLRDELTDINEKLRLLDPPPSEERKQKEQQISDLRKELRKEKKGFSEPGILKNKEKIQLLLRIIKLYAELLKKEISLAIYKFGQQWEYIKLLNAQKEKTYLELANVVLSDFGRYDKGEGVSPIEWIVLDQRGSKVLATTKYVLDSDIFDEITNDELGIVYLKITSGSLDTHRSKILIWENSSLRKWLNNTFFEEAFNQNEAKMIETRRISWDMPEKYYDKKDELKGKSTDDNIFLLSVEEAKRYFHSDNDRICPYLKGGKGVGWWLRTNGSIRDYIAIVDANGSIDGRDRYCTDKTGVRPAMWVNLDLLLCNSDLLPPTVSD